MVINQNEISKIASILHSMRLAVLLKLVILYDSGSSESCTNPYWAVRGKIIRNIYNHKIVNCFCDMPQGISYAGSFVNS